MTKPTYRVKADSQRVGDSLPQLTRGLENTVSGLGTSRDKARAATWRHYQFDPQQLEAAYRSNWLAKKVVNIPAEDMIREGWQWSGERDQVTAIEQLEEKLEIYAKLQEVLQFARLYGGGGLLIGDGEDDTTKELSLDRIAEFGIQYMTPLSKRELQSDALVLDPRSRYYGQPKSYRLVSYIEGMTNVVHPSRVLRFIGEPVPRDVNMKSDRWGDSVLEAAMITIEDAAASQAGIAALIQEASVDVIKIKNFMAQVSKKEYREAFTARVSEAMVQKSILNALLLDAEDEYSQKTANFGSLPEIQMQMMLLVGGGAGGIPATRFFGQSPGGLNATGESDLRNYYDGIASQRNLRYRAPISAILDLIALSATGNRDHGLTWDFRPLWQLSEKDKADIGKTRAETAKIYDESGLVDARILRKGVEGRLLEDETFPGMAAAIDEIGEPAEDAEGTLFARDASPRSLYVSRKVVNAAQIIRWAKAQGFRHTLKPDDLHVTLAFSRREIDWMKVRGSSEWESMLEIPEGGPRIVEALGDKGAVVLMFNSSALQWRHDEIKDAGASWDFPDFQPYITISYHGGDVDISAVTSYTGPIILGPEIFAEVDDDWRQKVKHS